jgi:polyferredoxin
MGIDIRDGSQLECINCGLCIDACDEIMDKVGRPRRLIAYDTDAAVEARAAGRPAVYRLVRARTIVYAVALVVVAGLMAWGLSTRPTLDVHVLRDRNPTFVRLHDGAVRNGYTIKIANRTFQDQAYVVAFDGPSGAVLKTPGGKPQPGQITVTTPANEVRAVRVFVTLPPAAITQDNLPASFSVTSPTGGVEAKTTFLSGAANPR